MTLTQQTAKHLREVFFGGNWTASNLKDVLNDISWEEAVSPIHDFNTISVLTFHVSYYLDALIDAIEGKPLTSKDELSFNPPTITSEHDWIHLQRCTWQKVEKAALLIEGLNDEHLTDDFVEKKYGTYYRNLHGIIEHSHYHLGQIVMLKQMVRKSN